MHQDIPQFESKPGLKKSLLLLRKFCTDPGHHERISDGKYASGNSSDAYLHFLNQSRDKKNANSTKYVY
jgi:hypothetical protein